MKVSILEKYVRAIISEALTAAEAEQRKLAVSITKVDDVRGAALSYALYDPNAVIDLMKSATSDDYSPPTAEQVEEMLPAYLIVVSHDDCNKALEVVNSVAKKGSGPFLYDMIMSDSNGGIMPDRGSVSNSAKNVWNVYYNKRSDVKKKPLDDKKNPKTEPKEDDCAVHGDKTLDNAYVGNPVDSQPFRARHFQAVKVAAEVGYDRKSYESMIQQLGTHHFNLKYKGKEGLAISRRS